MVYQPVLSYVGGSVVEGGWFMSVGRSAVEWAWFVSGGCAVEGAWWFMSVVGGWFRIASGGISPIYTHLSKVHPVRVGSK